MHYTEIFRQFATGASAAPVTVPVVLTDDEVDMMLDDIKRFEEQYFPTLPLDEELSKMFVYNIPKHIARGIITAHEMDLPDVMNPMLYLYPLFSSCVEDGIGAFIQSIVNLAYEDSLNGKFINRNAANWDGLEFKEDDEDTPTESEEESETDEEEE